MKKIIALTSANESAMAAVAEQLLAMSADQELPLAVMVGIKDASEATAVFTGRGQLWRVGEDCTHPELDELLDVQISDATPSIMASQVAKAARRYLVPRAATAGACC